MGLTGLEIYKLLPKTNCKKCGFPTCLAFAMQLAQKKVSLSKCPYVSDAAKSVLEASQEPPIRLVSFGNGEKKVEIGNETVLYRHEEKFQRAAAIGFEIDDTDSPEKIKEAILKISKLKFERVGQVMAPNCVLALNRSGSLEKFLTAINIIVSYADLALVFISDSLEVLSKSLEVYREKKPLIGYCSADNIDVLADLSKSYNVPIIVKHDDLAEIVNIVSMLNQKGIRDIIIYAGEKGLSGKIWDLTQVRKLAIKKNLRQLGYPVIVFPKGGDPHEEALEAVTFICKYAGIIILKHTQAWALLSILTARQSIYTDPQKPLQVSSKIYEIGPVGKDSPVLVTTNFSLTYYTVESEVEASKRGAYIIACDADGMSVLTAWAADKFTASSITGALNTSGISQKVSHKTVIIPGYVASLSSKIEDESGWKVVVGPREASGIPFFLRNYK